MTETVKRFQKQFNLTADGVVGRQTWYKISYIYVSVKDLAELTSEGETAAGTSPRTAPGAAPSCASALPAALWSSCSSG